MAFNYKAEAYQLKSANCIRLIQLQPVETNEALYSAEMELSMRVVSLGADAMLEGVSPEPPDRPTVRFDEDISVRPQEYFFVDKNSRCNVSQKPAGKLSRFFSKVKGRSKPGEQVPLTDPLPDEPVRRDRFKDWGNYVAMSEKRAKEEKKQENPPDPDDRDYTPVLHGPFFEVVIDGQRVRVRRNLWAALMRFRGLSRFREGIWLWNDALCINQADEDEMQAQLLLMSEIYRQAGNIVDIGDGFHRNENTPWVTKYLQGISVYYRTELYEAMDHADSVTAQNFRYSTKKKLDESAQNLAEKMRTDYCSIEQQFINDKTAISLYDYFDRPYWKRLWIIQELAMGHGTMLIVCGAGGITEWRYIRDAALMLSLVSDTITDAMQGALIRAGRKMKREPSFQHVATIAQLSTLGRRKALRETSDHQSGPSAVLNFINANLHSLPQLQTLQDSIITQALMLAGNSNCKMSRDRVNGLLALPALARLQSQVIEPAEMYLQFAEACIRVDRSLDIFSFLDGTNDRTKESMILPTWCPHFHYKTKIGRIEGPWRAAGDNGSWRAEDILMPSGLYDTAPIPQIRGKDLICHGWVVDSVDGLGALNESDRSNIGPQSKFEAGVLQPRFNPNWAAVSETLENMICMTLVGGTSVNGKKAPASFSCLLNSFPEEALPEYKFMYKRNWDFFQANGGLRIAGKPLKSYFAPQPVQNYAYGAAKVIGEHSADNIAEAHRAMETRSKYRRLMTTSKRPLLGLVPASTQQGDVVIILKYHSRPLIASCVIPDDADGVDERTWFIIRGEAYIPGIMDGELAEELFDTPLYSFTFK